MSEKKEEKQKKGKDGKTHLWKFNPSVFEPLPRAGFLRRRLQDPLRGLGKNLLYLLAFSYPVVVVSLGIIFGGLVFWTALAGSFGLMWLILKKTGYARNFANWDMGYKRFAGLLGAFGIVLAFFYFLIYQNQWFLPAVGAGTALTIIIGLLRFQRQ